MNDAAVYPHPRSPYLQAVFPVWDAKEERWKPKSKSTKCTDPADALVVARRFAKIAAAAGPRGRLSREYVVGAVNDILSVSGHNPIEDCPTWKEFGAKWLLLQKPRVKARSLVIFKSRINVFEKWLGKKADRPLVQFTTDELVQWYRTMLDEGRLTRTVNVMVDTIESIFERARDEGYIPRNPAALIMREPNNDTVREDFSNAQLKKLLAFLEESQDEDHKDWYTLTLFGLFTAQRLVDCTTVQWTRIKKEKPYWVWDLKQGKTGNEVQIPIVGKLAERLKDLEKKPGTSLFLMPSLAGQISGGTDGLSEQFLAILEAAKIEVTVFEKKGDKGATRRTLTFHSLRHSTNSILANANVSKDVRKTILGHMTDKHNENYTHMKTATTGPVLADALKGLG